MFIFNERVTPTFFVKNLYKERLFLIKFRLIRQIVMKLVHIYNMSVYWETGCFYGKKVAGHNCDFRDIFLPKQFVL